MMKKITVIFSFLLVAINIANFAHAQTPVVQAILFYSPTCPHCHDVMQNVLPPLKKAYGDQLQLLGIDTSKPSGAELYRSALEEFAPPDTTPFVPALLIGDVLTIGAENIRAQFPAQIEEGFAAGGVGWPDFPGLQQAVPDLPSSAGPSAGATAAAPLEDVGTGDILITDPLAEESPSRSNGYIAAWLVMAGMIVALGYALWRLMTTRRLRVDNTIRLRHWAIPILALVGIGVASYLAYVEITNVSAVCGPVGDCNAVQSSSHAVIFGIPVALLGFLFYLAILGLWAMIRFMSHSPTWTSTVLLLLTVAGTLFSIYLTALELFVIEAVCAWCLTSAVVTTAIMIITVHGITTKPVHPGRRRHSPQLG